MRSRLPLVPIFVKFIKQVSTDEDTILDVGCGTLRNDLRARLGERYKGLDQSSCLHPKDYEGDAEKLPFPDNSFDIVTAWSVVEHLMNPFIAILEMIRVAKKLVLLSTDYTERDKDGSANHLYAWTPQIFYQFLSKTGFKAKIWIEAGILFGLIWKSSTGGSLAK